MYLLKSAAILAILFAFYKLVLENTSIHNFKRIYLFGILMASFLIPFITFTSYVEVSPVIYTYTERTPQIAIPEAVESINYWPFVLWTIYGLGVLFFSVKFFRNLFILIQQIKTNPKYRNNGFINILLSKNVIPHTFFNYIFLNKKQFEKGEIPSEVILHEQTHAIQKHSLDVIFVELLQIIFWFNPLFYFLKRSIKLNHEFLADRAVLNAGAETSEYQKILLAFSSNDFTPALAHSINYLSIKKRFTVMKAHTSKRAILLRSLLILPLLSVLIYGFSTTHVITEFKEEINDSSEVSEILEITIDENENIYIENEKIPLEEFDEKITSKDYERTSISTSSKVSIEFGQHIILKLIEKDLADGIGFCVTADGNTILEDYVNKILEPLHNYNKSKDRKATEAEIAEYNKLAKKYNAVAIEKRVIPLKDLKVLETIYKKMTDGQKANAQPFPECLPTKKIITNNSTSPQKKSLKDATIYYKNKLITLEDAEDLLKKNNNLGMYIDKEGSGVGTIYLYEEPFDIKKIVIQKPTPTPTSIKTNGSTLNISRSDKTGFHFNTQSSTVTTLYYYEGNLIPSSRVHKLINENKNLRMYITEESFGHSIVTLSEKPILGLKESSKMETKAPSAQNGNLYMAAEAPPAPNANKIEYIKELAKKGATFYIGPHKYTTDEAIELVKKSKNDVTIDVSQYPIVHLGGC